MKLYLFRMQTDISLPILRELVPHYLQDGGKVSPLIIVLLVLLEFHL